MNAPTLVLGSTTITLPLPRFVGAPSKAEWQSNATWSIGGYLHVQGRPYHLVYRLSFANKPLATWTALCALRAAMETGNAFATFTWDATGPYPTANSGVAVWIRAIGDFSSPYVNKAYGDFDIELVEANPRTT